MKWTPEHLRDYEARRAIAGRQHRADPPASSEAGLHNQIIEECERLGWVYLHGSMASRTHRTLGEPDFVIATDHGGVLFVECKRMGGKLSTAQAAMQAHLRKLGHTMHVVRSFAEFLAVAS